MPEFFARYGSEDQARLCCFMTGIGSQQDQAHGRRAFAERP